MFGKKVNFRGVVAWTLAALAAPAAQFFGSIPWTWVLGAGAAAGLAWGFSWNRPGSLPRPWAAVILLGTVPALLLGLRYSGACWPGVPDEVQGWALLVLAAWAALRGSAAGTRYGAVVFCVSALTYGILLACALPGIKAENLRPVSTGDAPWPLLTLLVLLGLGAFQKEGSLHPWPWIGGMVLAIAALAAVCAGVMGPARTADMEGAFYDLVRSIRLFGVAERFEAVVSGIMTMGWFCYLTLLLSIAGEAGERLRPHGGPWAMAGAVAASCLLQLIV